MTTTNATHDKTDNLTNTKLSISTLNINGLAEDKKRNKLFENLINKKTDIILIQETHSTKKAIKKLEKEWTGKSFWNSGEIIKSSGVAILLRKNLKIEILTIQKDDKGRILSLAFYFEKQNFQIVNIYAPTLPTSDSPTEIPVASTAEAPVRFTKASNMLLPNTPNSSNILSTIL